MEFLRDLSKLLAENPWPAFTAILIVGNIWQYIALARERRAHLETARSVVPVAERLTAMIQTTVKMAKVRIEDAARQGSGMTTGGSKPPGSIPPPPERSGSGGSK